MRLPAWGLENTSLKAFLCGGGCTEGRDRLVKANVRGGEGLGSMAGRECGALPGGHRMAWDLRMTRG